jgi:hypothetical protein
MNKTVSIKDIQDKVGYYLIEGQKDYFYLVRNSAGLTCIYDEKDGWTKIDKLPEMAKLVDWDKLTGIGLMEILNNTIYNDNYHIRVLRQKLGWEIACMIFKQYEDTELFRK